MPYLNNEHFKQVLLDAYSQVFEGKGNERHGHGLALDHQPWKVITDNVGTGFTIGQALKKLMELKAFTPKDATQESIALAHKAWKREALGAIVYITMAIMYKEYEQSKV
jgi:hypothetical protein